MTISATALNAMTGATHQIEQVANQLNRSLANDPTGLDSFDLSQEAVALLSARTAFEAAVRLARIANETDNVLLDLLA